MSYRIIDNQRSYTAAGIDPREKRPIPEVATPAKPKPKLILRPITPQIDTPVAEKTTFGEVVLSILKVIGFLILVAVIGAGAGPTIALIVVLFPFYCLAMWIAKGCGWTPKKKIEPFDPQPRSLVGPSGRVYY